MTVAALTVAALALLGVLLISLTIHGMRRQQRGRNGHQDFVAWDWPARPVNGHDHPEPPELDREPAA